MSLVASTIWVASESLSTCPRRLVDWSRRNCQQAIYRKLGVSSRRDAVDRGRELGLICSPPFVLRMGNQPVWMSGGEGDPVSLTGRSVARRGACSPVRRGPKASQFAFSYEPRAAIRTGGGSWLR